MPKVIYSPGYGAGWGTWFTDDTHRVALVTDNELVRLVEAYMDGMISLDEFSGAFIIRAEQISPDAGYYGSIQRGEVAIEEVPDGVRWRIEEHDGAECVVLENRQMWWT
jgi:hypothetical protein